MPKNLLQTAQSVGHSLNALASSIAKARTLLDEHSLPGLTNLMMESPHLGDADLAFFMSLELGRNVRAEEVRNARSAPALHAEAIEQAKQHYRELNSQLSETFEILLRDGSPCDEQGLQLWIELVKELVSDHDFSDHDLDQLEANSLRLGSDLLDEVRLAVRLRAEAGRDLAAVSSTTSDTVSDQPKKTRRRSMNKVVADCARIYRKRQTTDPSVTMQSVVEEYVGQHGGSVSSILRTLNDNQDQWK